MVKLSGNFGKLKEFRALVVGDFMLDTYTKGNIDRISPEAPVSVLRVKHKEYRAGGAGNVALGLRALGGEVFVLGRIGEDRAGKNLRNTLEEQGVKVDLLIQEKETITPIKNRLIAERQQILRVDEEEFVLSSPKTEKKVMEGLTPLMPSLSVIAISDYNKGFLTPSLLEKIIALANEYRVPVVCDPKGSDFSKYQGVFLLKPNLKEAIIASGLDPTDSLEEIGRTIMEKAKVPYLLITQSEKGSSLFERDKSLRNFPVKSREVTDVTGAGDTVLVTLSAGIASGLDVASCVELANVSASIAIEKLGCASVSLNDLATRLLEIDANNKIFDEKHLYALKKSLENQIFSILVIDTTRGITPSLFQTIRKIVEKDEHKLILYIRDEDPDEDFIHVLSSLHEVGFIVLKKESLQSLCNSITPQKVHFVAPEKEHLSWLTALSEAGS